MRGADRGSDPVITPWKIGVAGIRQARSTPSELHEVRLHGHRVAYRMAGEGPAILLIHGITSSSETWNGVFELLARTTR